jgi:hypothetical protein
MEEYIHFKIWNRTKRLASIENVTIALVQSPTIVSVFGLPPPHAHD